MTDRNQALKADQEKERAVNLIAGRIEDEHRKHPNLDWPKIAAAKIYYQWKSYHSEPLIKEIEELKTELDEFREAAIIDIKENHSLEQQIEALKKENEISYKEYKAWQKKFNEMDERFTAYIHKTEKQLVDALDKKAKLELELTAIKSQKEPLMDLKLCSCGVPNQFHNTCCGWENASYPFAPWEAYVPNLTPAEKKERCEKFISWISQFKQSQEGKQVDVEDLKSRFCKSLGNGSSLIVDKVFDFFLPFLQSGEGREIDRYHANELKKAFTEIHKLKEMLEGREWISVEDRLPEYHEWVIAWFGNISLLAIRSESEGWVINFSNGKHLERDQERKITHWMPLPKSPLEK